MQKIYPDSGVELKPFVARNYDKWMNTVSFGIYSGFIRKVIAQMKINKENEKWPLPIPLSYEEGRS